MESFVLLIFRVDLLPRLDFSAGVDNSILNWILNELENFWIFPSRMISDVPTVISKAKNHKITFAFSMRFFTLVDIGKKCSLFFLREIPSPFLGLLGFSRLLGIGYFAKLAPNCVLAWCWEDKMVMFHYIHRGQSIRGTKQQDHPSYSSSGTSHSHHIAAEGRLKNQRKLGMSNCWARKYHPHITFQALKCQFSAFENGMMGKVKHHPHNDAESFSEQNR